MTYYEKYFNQTYSGYVFETIIDDGLVLFISDVVDVGNELFHNAPTYFHNKHPEFWNDEYKSRCWWIPKDKYEIIKRVLLKASNHDAQVDIEECRKELTIYLDVLKNGLAPK